MHNENAIFPSRYREEQKETSEYRHFTG